MPTTKPYYRTTNPEPPTTYAAGTAHSFEQEVLAARKLLAQVFGSVSDVPPGSIDDYFTGFIGTPDIPTIISVGLGGVLDWYLSGDLALKLSRTGIGADYRPQLLPQEGLGGYLGSAAKPWTSLYFDDIGSAIGGGILFGAGATGGITFGDATTQTTAAVAGAPTTADYLVGTAQGGLSAEIVVGATPGGELGNTWASPTVDATHSGSTHQVPVDVESDVTFTDATLGDITGLSFAVAASTKYVFQFHLFLRSIEDGGIKFDFSVPASPTAAAVRYIVNDASSHFSSSSIGDLTTDFEVAGLSLDNIAVVHIYGWFSNGANAGTVQPRGAQQADTGPSLIVGKGSHGLYGIVT